MSKGWKDVCDLVPVDRALLRFYSLFSRDFTTAMGIRLRAFQADMESEANQVGDAWRTARCW